MENNEAIQIFDEYIRLFQKTKDKEAQVRSRRYHENLLLLEKEQRKELFEEHFEWILERLPETFHHWTRFNDDLNIWGLLEEMNVVVAAALKDENRDKSLFPDLLFLACVTEYVLGNEDIAWSFNNIAMMTDSGHYPTLMFRGLMYGNEGEHRDAMFVYSCLLHDNPDDRVVKRALQRATFRDSVRITVTVSERKEEEETRK